MSLVCATVFAGDETQDVTKLDDLLVKVKKVLPQGWAASIELSDDMRPSRRGPFPTRAHLLSGSLNSGRLLIGHPSAMRRFFCRGNGPAPRLDAVRAGCRR